MTDLDAMTPPQRQVAQWAPSAVLLAVAAYLSSSMLEFKGEVLTSLAELKVQAHQQTIDIADLKQSQSSLVTRAAMIEYIELQMLKTHGNGKDK